MEDLTQAELKRKLHYDPDTGIFTWKVFSPGITIGKVAGAISSGYIRIKVHPSLQYAHRLAWLYVYGYFPEHGTDHINGIKTDNRIANLREATHDSTSTRSMSPPQYGQYWNSSIAIPGSPGTVTLHPVVQCVPKSNHSQ